jgi:hypothetical protein
LKIKQELEGHLVKVINTLPNLLHDHNVKVEVENEQIVIVLIFLHSVDKLKGIVQLSVENNHSCIHDLSRVFLESSLRLQYCIENREYLKNYILESEKQRKASLNDILNNPEVFKHFDHDLLESAKNKMEFDDPKHIGLPKIAHDLDKKFEYFLYRYLSRSIHSMASFVSARLITDEKRRPIQILADYPSNETEALLLTCTDETYKIFSKICIHLNQKDILESEKYKLLTAEFSKIAENMKSDKKSNLS